MNKYGQAAIMAVKLITDKKMIDPIIAWDESTTKIFGRGTSSQSKGCPRGAFLGLCEEGLVVGIPPGDYTKSKHNKLYSVEAVKILKFNDDYDISPSQLWKKVIQNGNKAHNSQMDVVLALWANGLIEINNV